MSLPVLFQFLKHSLSLFLLSCCLFSGQIAFSQYISTVAGNGKNGAFVSGSPALHSSIPYPTGVCVDGAGNLYITTAETVRKVAAGTGLTTLFAGNGSFGYSGDGIQATEASLQSPVAVCADNKGNVYVAEYYGHRIRRISPAGVITTVAGTGKAGYSGDGGKATAAQLRSPRGIAVDDYGNLYIADFHNHRIRRVNLGSGIITTVAGTGLPLFSEDGTMAAATAIVAPSGVFVTKTGDVLFAESDLNISCRIRKIAAGTGLLTTVAGSHLSGHSGDGESGLAAGLSVPTGVAADAAGNLYISEHYGSRIRKVDAGTGLITTIAGGGAQGFCCDDGPAANALLNNPMALALDTLGNVLVADNYNHRIRKIEVKPTCNTPSVLLQASSALFCYNASPKFTVSQAGTIINAVYHWQKNGSLFGTTNNASAVIPAAAGDVIVCQVTGTTVCGDAVSLLTNSITMLSNPGYQQEPEVVIVVDKETSCAGTPVHFTAINKSGSARPVFQWLVNGKPVGDGTAIFTTAALVSGDKVECSMTVAHCGNDGGTTKDYSNTITVNINPAPEILFKPSAYTIEPGQQVQLAPNLQLPIAWHQWTPALALADPSRLSPLTNPLYQTTTFQLQVKTSAGCTATENVTVTVYAGLFIPTAFTPNGDGKNDVFRLPATAAFTLKDFQVFDRWGATVFFTTDSRKGWDGKKEGANAATGTYVYQIRGEDNKGPVFIKGTVQLLR